MHARLAMIRFACIQTKKEVNPIYLSIHLCTYLSIFIFISIYI